jgi:hypothetical protein
MSTALSFIEQYNELLNERDREIEKTKEKIEEINKSNEIYMTSYHYRCNPSVSRRYGFRV